jgi:polyketide cyclase/dehydrase/lipid transport protein
MIVLYVIAGLIALILIIAALIGTAWNFEKSITISAPVEKIWENINSLQALNRWNPWIAKDPNIKIEYSGTDGTLGAKFSWLSADKNVGEGSQTIVKITDKSELLSRVDFIKPFAGTGNAFMRLAPEGSATKATWRMESSTPYPMNFIKIFGVIEKNMDRDFNAGLNKLKEICEK